MKKRKKSPKIIKFLVIIILWLLVLGIIGFLTAFAYFAPQIPSPESIITRRVSESTKIFDQTGNTVLYDIYGEERRTIIGSEQIPEYLKMAVIVAEDANFYKHRGLDIKGILRASWVNLRAKTFVQGGSTITQQLVRNSLLGTEKTLSRKFKEVILSLQIERQFEKDQILWMYLNQIPFGSNVFGVEAASQKFFGKPANGLNLNESAVLAALIKAPSYFSPYGSHKDGLLERKDAVLDRMVGLGLIDEETKNRAENEELKFAAGEKGILAPHFVIMVREYLVEKYGEELIQTGGLRVYTTLNWELQQKAEEAVKKYADRNEELFKAGNAALAALDPRTGEILALVGSRDYFNIEKGGNFNVATALRQPGSAFKPIVYSVALDKGLTDRTILFDLKTEFNPLCSPEGNQEFDVFGNKCYHPQNSDEKFRGPVTLRQALASSLNIPSVKILYLAGIKNSLERAWELGITSLKDPDRFGLSLVLGGGEIRLVELASAYGAFANDGTYSPPQFISKIMDSEGKILEELNLNPQRKVSAQTSRMINDILSDNSARALLFGLQSPLYIPERPVAVKTGTTQNFRDAWTVGYTPSLVAGVWVGNNDNTPMTKEGGGVSAGAPIWREFIVEALKDKPNEEFIKPEPIFVDKIMLNGNFVNENGEIHTILHYIDKNNPSGAAPTGPSQDQQYKNWEWSVRTNWSY